MLSITDRFREKSSLLVFWTKFVVVVYSMLISVPLLHNWLYSGKKLLSVWMVLLVLWQMATRPKDFKLWEYLGLMLCCVFYGFTILFNDRSHLLNEVMVLLYMGCSYFMLTCCSPDLSPEQVRKEIRFLASTAVVLSFLFAAANLSWYFAAYLAPGLLPVSDYFAGINNNQLGGIYNPNTGGTHNYISILFSVLLMRGASRGKRVFLVLNMLLQFVCFSLVQSRGAWIALLAFIILYFLFIWDRKSLSLGRKVLCKGALMLACILVLTNASQFTRQQLSDLVVSLEVQEGLVNPMDPTQPDNRLPSLPTNPTRPNPTLPSTPVLTDRDYTRGGHTDLTTGRMELWTIGLRAWAQHPILGVGYRNIDDALKEGLSEFDYWNSGSGGLHNVYVTVLVSGGLAGFLPFAAVIVLLLLRVLKLYLDPQAPNCAKVVATMIPAWLVGELVESRIAMSFTHMNVFFWIAAGYVLYYTRKREAK